MRVRGATNPLFQLVDAFLSSWFKRMRVHDSEHPDPDASLGGSRTVRCHKFNHADTSFTTYRRGEQITRLHPAITRLNFFVPVAQHSSPVYHGSPSLRSRRPASRLSSAGDTRRPSAPPGFHRRRPRYPRVRGGRSAARGQDRCSPASRPVVCASCRVDHRDSCRAGRRRGAAAATGTARTAAPSYELVDAPVSRLEHRRRRRRWRQQQQQQQQREPAPLG